MHVEVTLQGVPPEDPAYLTLPANSLNEPGRALEFLPAMPPSTVSGKVTKMMQIVPKGSAAVERYTIATVFRNANTTSSGPQKSAVVSSTLRTQFVPPMTL